MALQSSRSPRRFCCRRPVGIRCGDARRSFMPRLVPPHTQHIPNKRYASSVRTLRFGSKQVDLLRMPGGYLSLPIWLLKGLLLFIVALLKTPLSRHGESVQTTTANRRNVHDDDCFAFSGYYYDDMCLGRSEGGYKQGSNDGHDDGDK